MYHYDYYCYVVVIVDCLEWLRDFQPFVDHCMAEEPRCFPALMINSCCCVILGAGLEVFLWKLLHNEGAGGQNKCTKRSL